MKAELLQKGKNLLLKINLCREELSVFRRVHSLRLGIVRAKADALPEPAPDGVYYLITRFQPSGGDEPAPDDFAFVVTKPGLTFQDAEESWEELEELSRPLRSKVDALRRELEEIDMQVRDYAGAEQTAAGNWILRNRRGGILVDKTVLGDPVPDEPTLRRIAYRYWREHVFEPSPFGVQNPTFL
jgi:hypothetical protein